MIEDAAALVVPLLKNICVIVVIAYLITRTKPFTEVLEKKFTWKNQAILIAIFGCFSIFGTYSGIEIFGAIANVRDLGPMIGGLACGPFVGIGAGIIGAVHRISLGGFTGVPCSIATLCAGIIGGAIYKLNKGKFAKYWEPIPMDMYLAPTLFYKPPAEPAIEAKREECVACHAGATHGWVKSWEKSVHANLDKIRALPASDARAYKKEIIAEVEDNLRLQGLLGKGEPLKEVQCIDCHMGVGAKSGNHAKDL
ncbi:MAG TPA: LytS/YhcK type 5TM receptor domain-containing protein, partial [Candidatus Methanomethylicus sp.]|nr:LytS/YhcK type 5TM receptor domain-containing protein [Candidatus Methanomethylicus sp.]